MLYVCWNMYAYDTELHFSHSDLSAALTNCIWLIVNRLRVNVMWSDYACWLVKDRISKWYCFEVVKYCQKYIWVQLYLDKHLTWQATFLAYLERNFVLLIVLSLLPLEFFSCYIKLIFYQFWTVWSPSNLISTHHLKTFYIIFAIIQYFYLLN